MGIYVAKASAIRDLLMKHYPQARSPSACRPLGMFMKHVSLQPCRGCMSARAYVTAQGCLVPCSCRMCAPAHTMQGSAVQDALLACCHWVTLVFCSPVQYTRDSLIIGKCSCLPAYRVSRALLHG